MKRFSSIKREAFSDKVLFRQRPEGSKWESPSGYLGEEHSRKRTGVKVLRQKRAWVFEELGEGEED